MAAFFEFKALGFNDKRYTYCKVVNIDHISCWSLCSDSDLGRVIVVEIDGFYTFKISKDEFRRFERFLKEDGHSVILLEDYSDE